jgi:hypothetical protein
MKLPNSCYTIGRSNAAVRTHRRACLDALDNKITATPARNPFIEAARQADIYIGQQTLRH